MNIFKLSVLAVLLATVVTSTYGKDPVTDAELQLMPPFCKAKSGKASPSEQRHWQNTFGRDNWVSMHHYCGNARDELRASKLLDQKMRNRGLRGAREGYQNHLAETTKDYKMRYELYYRIGNISRKLNDTGTAMQAYHNSIQLKPKYTGSYIGLSNIYRDMGQYQEAIDVINQGLAYKPKSRGLLRRKSELEKKLREGEGQPAATKQN